MSTSPKTLGEAFTTISPDEEKYEFSLLAPREALADPSVRLQWESFLRRRDPLYRVFATPTLYEHQCQTSPKPENQVAVIRDGADRIVGICPIIFWRLTLPFQLRRRVLARITLRAATILGGEPLAHPEPALYRCLFKGLLQQLPWCDCVYLNSIPADGFASRFLVETCGRTDHNLIYPSQLERRDFIYHLFGSSFDEFLLGKQKRTRNTLKRRVRKLKEHGQGVLECCRIQTPDQVEDFYPAALSIAERSWQSQCLGRSLEETALHRESLMSAAKLGCLRAYLLKCGGQPCAFVIGYQDGDVLQFEQTAYSQKWHQFSPGTVLYYLLMQDLYEHGRPNLLNFGVGINPHKRLFSNRNSFDTTFFVLRPTLRNRLRMASYNGFCGGLKLARRLLKKGLTVEEADDGESDDPSVPLT